MLLGGGSACVHSDTVFGLLAIDNNADIDMMYVVVDLCCRTHCMLARDQDHIRFVDILHATLYGH